MKKATRNMIRKAEKVGLTVKHGNDLKLFDDFVKVYQDTIDRNKWTAYSVDYIKKEFEIFEKAGCADIFVSYLSNEPISAAIFIRHRDQIIYHFGGSLSKYRDIPASYLTQWEAIKFYKKAGYKLYNFWGVSPEGMKRHPWNGFSLFKRGFSQQELEFIHSLDLDLHPFAKFTHLYEYVEAKLRGYT
jgi:peptidoglycan pentaglycine glycine transferase (the first glycine)